MPDTQLTVIKPKSGWFEINFRELFKYRDLISLFVKRTFTSQYKQTILGPAWAIIQPLLTTVIFTIIFGNIAKLPTDGVPPFLFYMCANVPWTYFSNCITQTSNTFVSNAYIFGKVYFPRLIIPISNVITGLISYAIQFVFFLCFLAYYLLTPGCSVHITAYALMMPLFVIQMSLLSLGFGIIVSSLTTKYRDLTMLVGFGVQLWMYATPIAYPSSIIPEKWMALYMLNPMSPIIEYFRYAFLGCGSIDWKYIGISAAMTLVILAIGVILFSKVEKTFMDTV
ncbi:MAG: ABC transporter permease [Oscillospiraceae bacterium]|nr:ABC transporter permease [Oscillospiraceae bacterium]